MRTPYDQPASTITPPKKLFTVILEHTDSHPDAERTIVSVIMEADDPKDAADNAGLWLIHDRGGVAAPMYVIKGAPTLRVCDGSAFDAEDFDETITFVGYVRHKNLTQ